MNKPLPLMYWLDLGGQRFEVREVRGVEAMSTPFRFEIAFAEDEGAAIDPDAVIRTQAVLHLMRGPVEERHVQGIVTSISVGVAKKRAPEIRLVLEPRLALARFRQDIRVFRKKTAPEIVVEVLSGLGIPTDNRLAGSYVRRPYCVQLRETDLDFVHRMLEDEGIYYYHTEDDVMVLGDKASAYEPSGPLLPFRSGTGLDRDEDAVFAIGARASVGPSKLTLRDWNPAHPSLDMDVQATTPLPAGPEYYDYPGEYLEPSEGQRKVDLRAEAVVCAHGATRGKTFSAKLFPGLVFHVEDAPSASFDGGHVVTRIEHAYERGRGGFEAAFEALGAEVVFRPAVVTEAPRLLNPMTGFVTGAPGDDICTNETGDVKVHFHWDRLQPYDDDCSHWVPVLQDNTGHSIGISRVGWEVLCHFQEGDPDRPVVLGRVYNADDSFPQRLPEMKTRSALKSLWSPRDDKGELQGTNEIQFEDLAGQERIWIYAERDQNIVIANNRDEHVEADETRVIKHDESIDIGGNQKQDLHANFLPTVEGNQKWKVGGDRTRHTVGNESMTVQGDRKVTISGSHTRKMGTDDRTNVTKNLTENICGSDTEESETNNLVQAELSSKLDVGGSLTETCKENKMESTAQKRKETIMGNVTVTAEGSVAMRCDDERKTSIVATLTATATEEMVIAGLDQLRMESRTGILDGATQVTFKVGDTQIILKDGTIAMKAPNDITIDTSSENNLGSGTSRQIGSPEETC